MELLHYIVNMHDTEFYSALAFAFVFSVLVPAVIIRFYKVGA